MVRWLFTLSENRMGDGKKIFGVEQQSVSMVKLHQQNLPYINKNASTHFFSLLKHRIAKSYSFVSQFGATKLGALCRQHPMNFSLFIFYQSLKLWSQKVDLFKFEKSQFLMLKIGTNQPRLGFFHTFAIIYNFMDSV